jgi:4-hydroxy-3-methylbut-2-enyl diphosphate reductase
LRLADDRDRPFVEAFDGCEVCWRQVVGGGKVYLTRTSTRQETKSIRNYKIRGRENLDIAGHLVRIRIDAWRQRVSAGVRLVRAALRWALDSHLGGLMKILLASPRGFCAGVNMAIEALERAVARFGAPLYAFHEIVHNRRVVERFRELGVVFIDDVDEAPIGSRLVISAHGVAPAVRSRSEARQLQVIDATCPLVRKVHLAATKFASQGYTIVYIGHRGHDEVVAALGHAPEQMVLVESIADVDRLSLADPEKIAYLTQTTLSVDETAAIIARLRARYPACVASPKEDICFATQNRQESLKALVGEADVVLVAGSRNSSNSNRLAELARSQGCPAYLVDGSQDLDDAWFQNDQTVLITAGASAPESVVDELVAYLGRRSGAEAEERSVRIEEVGTFPLPLEVR